MGKFPVNLSRFIIEQQAGHPAATGEFSVLLGRTGFRHIWSGFWTFIPKGDMPASIASLLTVLDAIGQHVRLDSLRGGLALCAWKGAKIL